MKLVNFKRLRTQSPTFEIIQDNVQSFVRQLEVNEFLGGLLISGQEHLPATGYTKIYHKLGQIPKGGWSTAGTVYPAPQFVSGSIVPAGSLWNGIVSYHKLDGNALDSGPNGLHGTLSAVPPVAVSGKINGCYDFDNSGAANKSISIADCALLRLPKYTFSCWANPGSLTSFHIISQKGYYDGAVQDLQWMLYLDNATYKLTSYIEFTDGSTHGVQDPGAAPSVGTWYHFATSYDGEWIRLYKDGAQVNAANVGLDVQMTTWDYYLGRRGHASKSYHFDGLIDEVGLWNRALSASEISSLYNSGSGLEYLHPDSYAPTSEYFYTYSSDSNQDRTFDFWVF